MKKIIRFYTIAMVFFAINHQIFCQNPLYIVGFDDNYPIMKTMKLNQSTCTIDTISRWHIDLSQGYELSGSDYNRGFTCTCKDFIIGLNGDNGISGFLNMSLTQDTSYIINFPNPMIMELLSMSIVLKIIQYMG